jgi:hypothetical protein
MTVQITPKSVQHTGLAPSMEGSVAAWEVTFELDGDESLHVAVSIPLAGPPTHHEAQQKALKILQDFLNDEVAPVSWTPDLWSFRSPQWQESTRPMRRNSAGR